MGNVNSDGLEVRDQSIADALQPSFVELYPDDAYQVVDAMTPYIAGQVLDGGDLSELNPVKISQQKELATILGKAITFDLYKTNPDFACYCVRALSKGVVWHFFLSEEPIETLSRIINSKEFDLGCEDLRCIALRGLTMKMGKIDIQGERRIKQILLEYLRTNTISEENLRMALRVLVKDF